MQFVLYEFVLVNLYTKISEKKICIRVGISTPDQYLRLKSSRSAIHHPPPPLVPILFIYHTIRLPSAKVDYTISLVWHSQPQSPKNGNKLYSERG